jgi:flagellar hook assembly protein FlgD
MSFLPAAGIEGQASTHLTFNSTTKIKFALPEAGAVKLQIYDLLGNVVKTLASGKYASGRYEAVWDSRNRAGETVADGIYLYRLVVERENGEAPMVMTKKMTFLK